nr:sigma-70 family RNA polymerase sigma factor [Demetria terragena]
MPEWPEPAVERLLREQSPHVVSALVRRYGDFETSEDAAQEAMLAAHVQWPRDGLPADPRGWLIRVASRRLIDQWRSETARRDREARDDRHQTEFGSTSVTPDTDDSLTLMLMCCHPALTRTAQIPLTLRAVGGLTTAQIGQVLLTSESTVAQRISRAKSRLREAGARFAAPVDPGSRLAAVQQVLYLIFTEGHSPSTTSADQVSATREAIRLARMLREHCPHDRETAGLLALMLLTEARQEARFDANGALVALTDQDRTLWDQDQIREGIAILEATLPGGSAGPYALQAAMAAVHSDAATAASTDWPQILVLYDLLSATSPGPVVRLNRAVAVAMVHGPQAGLREVEAIADARELRGSHRVHAVRAHLLEMSGAFEAAREAYAHAAARATNPAEQAYLRARMSGAQDPSD